MKKRIFLILFLISGMLVLSACGIKENNLNDAQKFKEEYEGFNGEKNDYFEYRNLSINEENSIIYSSVEEIVQKIENNETFIVYFGDPECPWCRSIIEQAINSANDNGISKIYYVRIWNGFHNEILRDVYELGQDSPVLKEKGTDSYYKLLKYFDKLLKYYTLTNKNNKTIQVNEKRILAPNFIYINNGNPIDLIDGISSKQESYNSDLTEEILKEEKEKFDRFYQNTKICSEKC